MHTHTNEAQPAMTSLSLPDSRHRRRALANRLAWLHVDGRGQFCGPPYMRYRGGLYYRVDQKSKPDNFCNNFVYCQPIFIIFGTYMYRRKFATGGCIVSPPSMVNVTALPCKILITTLPICLYIFTTINNNIYNKTAELSQRRPRDAPNIWVHWKVLRVLNMHPTTFPEICNGLCSDRY